MRRPEFPLNIFQMSISFKLSSCMGMVPWPLPVFGQLAGALYAGNALFFLFDLSAQLHSSLHLFDLINIISKVSFFLTFSQVYILL